MTTEPRVLTLANEVLANALRAPAWTGLGAELQPNTPIQDALRQAGLAWRVRKLPLYFRQEEPEPLAYVSVPQRYAVVREDTHRPLGVVSEQYRPVQNLEAAEFAESLRTGGEITLSSAGSFHHGGQVWFQMTLPHMAMIKGVDPIKSMLTIVNGHDGGLGFRTFWTNVRIYCQNSMMRAIRQASMMFNLRHSTNIMDRIKQARQVLGITEAQFGDWIAEAERLAQFSFMKAEMDEFLKKVLEIDPELPREKQPRKYHAMDRIEELVEVGAGLQMPEIKGTKYALGQAINEYVDHERGKNADRRVHSAWFGDGAELKARAWNALLRSTN